MKLLATCLICAFLVACGSSVPDAPDLAALYRDEATSEVRNPVIVIHGILGSRLVRQRDGRVVWGAFTNEALAPDEPEGARALALPLDRTGMGAEGFDPASEPVVATGPVDRLPVDFLFFTINVSVYAGILKSLGVGGYRDVVTSGPAAPDYGDHFTCYSFFYDWRQDCVANARALARFIAEKRREIDEKLPGYVARLRASRDPSSRREADELEAMLERGFRFDIVAHSMGGLIARWFLRYGEQDLPPGGGLPELDWRGGADVDRLLLVGTPSAGSLVAFERLQDGFQPAFITPYYDPAVIGTMPSLYQLLPRSRHRVVTDDQGRVIDLLDPEVWIRNRWGMLRPDSSEALGWLLSGVEGEAARRRRAEGTIRAGLERARRFHEALDVAPGTPCPSRIHLFAADTEPTPLRLRLERDDSGRLTPDFSRAESGFGDGTVARYSALADERQDGEWFPYLRSPVPWHAKVFIPDDHVGLTRNPVFTDNLLHILLEEPPDRMRAGP